MNAFDNATETRATVVAIGFNWQNGGGYGNANPGLGITIEGTGPLSRSQVPAVAQTLTFGITDDETFGEDVLPTMQTPSASSGGHPPAVAYDEFNDSTADIHHTLRAGTRQATGAIQGMKVRRLTPRECERLQGFPDDWTRVNDKTADSHRYKQMGNAVTVNVAHYIAELINSAVKEQP